ncbi:MULTISPECIES: fumarylacetoacetate hydrolase family protein [Paraburkholderia]|uniref:FAA hydrolase family protein n=1 Tax=Paraburkholderia dipogonis TaxID=1211383 RepID=A0A4Y8MGY7_9BURK|nr:MULTISPECIES: fumarylacetoacetate hydrolase family protein [Paraburkholderia]RKR31377.1 5-oxopent-3-ene-1,2,5-tricarboxylate decarboxylase/2-hydroxyhepta-2,4-diene-1,7-dioate isomerase [Paraburkholderia sp. BL17N1]TFE36663.1 FAA hydrolase family protein [Paraburkholderia dipogonis]
MSLYEFPPRELPAVMRGPRVERRRVLVNGSPCWGTMTDDLRLRLDDGRVVDTGAVQHLPPCDPTKIICVHLSYSSRGVETRNNPKPTLTPTYFTKPITALNGHLGELVKPLDCEYLNYEGEYAVVIGKVCRNVTPDEAWDYMLGFVPALDMGLQNFRDTDQGSMLRVKGADGMLPLGPGIVTGIDIFEQTLRTYRNGQLVQEARIGDEMIWGPHYMVADIARHITLVPGDVILTGTPCHSRSVDVGDLVEVEVTGLGRLASRVVAGPAPRASALGVGHAPTDSPEVRRVALGFDERVPERFRESYRCASKKEST